MTPADLPELDTAPRFGELTPHSERAVLVNIASLGLGVFGTILAGIVLTLLTGGWASKESTKDHAADVQAIRAEINAGFQAVNSHIQRVSDQVCQSATRAPLCRPPTEP